MPNGKFLPDDVFELLERPLLRLDKAWEEFATFVNGRVERNYHFLPGRMILAEGKDGLLQQIGITPIKQDVQQEGSQGNHVYLVWVAIYRDAPEGRYLSRKEILRTENIPEGEEEVTKLLEQCWAEIQELKKGKLKLSPAYDPNNP